MERNEINPFCRLVSRLFINDSPDQWKGGGEGGKLERQLTTAHDT